MDNLSPEAVHPRGPVERARYHYHPIRVVSPACASRHLAVVSVTNQRRPPPRLRPGGLALAWGSTSLTAPTRKLVIRAVRPR